MRFSRPPDARVATFVALLAVVLTLLHGVELLLASNGAKGPSAHSHTAVQVTARPGPVPPSSMSTHPSPSTTSVSPPSETPETPAPTTSSTPPDRATKILALLAMVDVVADRPNVAGYERGCGPGEACSFGTDWSDATDAPDSHNGCDTRNDVLREDLRDTEIDPATRGCVVLTGVLDDPYTGKTIDFVRGYDTSIAVQIDHVIPLAAAWDLGAWSWSPARRATFANDTAHELIAVDGAANLAKSDSTPESWLPPNGEFHCEYALKYLKASRFWKLPITAGDADSLRRVAKQSC